MPALVLRAVELELALGRHDDALVRADALAAHAQRKERWLALRGTVLAHAGRDSEAREAWRAALDAIHRLPARHRRTRASLDLITEFESRLAHPPESHAKDSP